MIPVAWDHVFEEQAAGVEAVEGLFSVAALGGGVAVLGALQPETE